MSAISNIIVWSWNALRDLKVLAHASSELGVITGLQTLNIPVKKNIFFVICIDLHFLSQIISLRTLDPITYQTIIKS